MEQVFYGRQGEEKKVTATNTGCVDRLAPAWRVKHPLVNVDIYTLFQSEWRPNYSKLSTQIQLRQVCMDNEKGVVERIESNQLSLKPTL